MSLFKKKEKPACACGAAPCESGAPTGDESDAAVKVLGGGCPNCLKLEAAAKEALTRLGMDPAIGHVTDYARIAAYGVMATPALVVDGKVVSAGRVLKADEIVEILKKVR